MKANQNIMQEARNRLTGKWDVSILSYLVGSVIPGAVGPAGLIIGGPMRFGLSVFSLNLSRKKKVEFLQIFEGFKRRIGESIVAYILTILYIFLWSLLLIIPGIVAAIGYSQTFFILADDDKISGVDAMRKSMRMMQGYKWRFFCLLLRFFGWFILSILTLGIGFLFLIPYIQVSVAVFYDELRQQKA